MRSLCKPLKPGMGRDRVSILAVMCSGNDTQSSKIVHGVRVKTQYLRAHTALVEDPILFSSTHTRQLTTAYNSSPMRV